MGIPNEAVDELEDAHLIRGEWRAGGRWFELNHDRFIEPIRESNRAWLAERGAARQTLERLEKGAAEWPQRGEAGLLDEGELAEAERWLDSPEADELGKPDQVLGLIRASRTAVDERKRTLEAEARRAEEEAHAAKRFKRLSFALAVVSLLAVGAAVYAWRQQQRAETQQQRAEKNEQQARENESRALESEELARQLSNELWTARDQQKKLPCGQGRPKH